MLWNEKPQKQSKRKMKSYELPFDERNEMKKKNGNKTHKNLRNNNNNCIFYWSDITAHSHMKFNLNHVRIRVAVESYKAEEIERQQHQQKLKKRDQHTHAQLFGRQMKSHKKSRFARSDWVSKQKKNEEEIFFFDKKPTKGA